MSKAKIEITLEDVINREFNLKVLELRFDSMLPELRKAFIYLYRWVKSGNEAYVYFEVFDSFPENPDCAEDDEFLRIAIRREPFLYAAYTAWEYGGDELLRQIKEYLLDDEEEEEEDE